MEEVVVTLFPTREQWSTVASQAVALPCVEVQGCPLLLELQAPAHGSVRTPLTVSYLVHNRTLLVQDIELVMDSSDAFMYSGNKLVRGPARFLGRRRVGFCQAAFRCFRPFSSSCTFGSCLGSVRR
ncbi:unnamed protein product [Ixodes pacificus]